MTGGVAFTGEKLEVADSLDPMSAPPAPPCPPQLLKPLTDLSRLVMTEAADTEEQLLELGAPESLAIVNAAAAIATLMAYMYPVRGDLDAMIEAMRAAHHAAMRMPSEDRSQQLAQIRGK